MAELRTHVILPSELVKQIDGIVGKRQRSRFITESVRNELRRLKLLKSLDKTAGILAGKKSSGKAAMAAGNQASSGKPNLPAHSAKTGAKRSCS